MAHIATQTQSQQPRTRPSGPGSRAGTRAPCSPGLLGLSWISHASSSAHLGTVPCRRILGPRTCSTQGNKTKAMLSTCRPRLLSAQSCCATLALKDDRYFLQDTNLHDKSWRRWPQKQDSADSFNTYIYTVSYKVIYKAELTLLHGEEKKFPQPQTM